MKFAFVKMLAKRALNIAPSATLAIDAKAKQLKKNGEDIVVFGAGQPDFSTPDNIKQAAIKAINDNFTGYTPSGGIIELKQAVAAKLKRDNNLTYDPSEILISCGGKHTLHNIMQVLLNKGDKVILPTPYWVSYEEQIKLAEAKPIFVKTDKKFKITADKIAEKINKKTKLIILTSPSNPTGAVIDEEELVKIADLAIKNNIYVISDEVYEFFIYDGKKQFSIASLNDQIKALTITVNAVSKTYSMTGWRIGYCAGPKEIINAMDNLQSHTTSNPTSIAQKAALEALNGPQDSVKIMVDEFDKRRKYMTERLNQIKGISCSLPEGAFYCFPDISKTKLGSIDFSNRLLDEAKVAVVPGIAFGSDKHARLSYATSMDDIKKGMDRIEEFCNKL
ncbi:MAG: pyridoxal phosphate-dependent aminotransferase [Candidatus Woesearchaeota archaeon]|nr:pyridoxal phosphate-dependent aminotransferase [Candidatus Woesearchaeota archaeon]